MNRVVAPLIAAARSDKTSPASVGRPGTANPSPKATAVHPAPRETRDLADRQAVARDQRSDSGRRTPPPSRGARRLARRWGARGADISNTSARTRRRTTDRPRARPTTCRRFSNSGSTSAACRIGQTPALATSIATWFTPQQAQQQTTASTAPASSRSAAPALGLRS